MELKNDLTISNLTFKFPLHEFMDIPLNLSIDRIYYDFDESLDFEIFQDNNLEFESEKLVEIKVLKRNFNFIETEEKLYDNFTKNFLEHNELESVDDLLFILNELELNRLNNYIDRYKVILKKEYDRRLNLLFRLQQKEPTINLKDKFPKPDKDIKDFTLRDRSYMLMQLATEYNPTPIFPENKNKTIDEWSFRETELHLAYLTCKTRIENVESKFQAKCQEDMMKDGNK